MIRRALAPLLCAASILTAAPASAAVGEWTEMEVKKVQDALKRGKKVDESGWLAESEAQLVSFQVGRGLSAIAYIIDMRAQLCFVRGSPNGVPQSTSPVPCATLKKAYPLFAPLITWEQ